MAPILPGAQMGRRRASQSSQVPVSVRRLVEKGIVGGTSKFAAALSLRAVGGETGTAPIALRTSSKHCGK